ncbi:response regulator [Nisaea acidiphila]|uniref:Response regulator n=1 Tax=Nisaea acidiphila TaxID=1862145 RepID=A0A9J7AUT0_9PROT|nr:response regulator [Nisaea acidiphila]UUX50076.1 response regulator [Nisaea acidiphila]
MSIAVLFVDDDQNFLEGLRRSFAKYRNEWRIEIALGAEKAFEAMEKRCFDIVVSDQDMPGQSGDYLLGAIADRWPSTIRVTLSGRAKTEIASALISKAHFILTKPCESEDIAAYVTRLAEKAKEIKNDFVRSAMASITTPILPTRSKRGISEGRLDSDLITGASLLQIAVSHLSNDGKSGAQAVTDSTVRLAAEQLVRVAGEEKMDPYSNCHVERLWTETVEIAETAKAMGAAAGIEGLEAQHLEIAAAFCNIGSIALAAKFPDLYQKEVGEAETPQRWEAERKFFGASGLTIAAYLLAIWGFSDAVIDEVINQNVTLSTMAGHDTTERVLSSARDREWPKPVEIENIEENGSESAQPATAPQRQKAEG